MAVGLVLRVLFLLVGAKLFFAERQADIFTNGDSFSYILSFQNLLEFGRYSFDLNEPEAAVGRLPGYPFFYGIHQLLFGADYALLAVAVTQVVLDTLGIWLIFTITAHLTTARSWAPYLAALLLTFYPFSIVWVPIVGTETVGLFLTLLWWAMLSLTRPRTANWLALGVLLAVTVYVREFLGVCLVVTLIYLLSDLRPKQAMTVLRPMALVLVGFLGLYVWWPVRNYVTTGHFILLKPVSAGYANLREDTQGALAWMLTWTNDVTEGFAEIEYALKPAFPDYVISTPAEKQLIDSLCVMSRTCASSFYVMMHPGVLSAKAAGRTPADSLRSGQVRRLEALRQHNCNAQVSAGFNRLRASYIRRHPVRARLEVPLQNFQKILFKHQFETSPGQQLSPAQRLSATLFVWRSILLVLGLVGAWKYRNLPNLRPALLFTTIIFVFMACIFRSLEMRYLLQADVLMLVPAALLLAKWVPGRWSGSSKPVTSA
jgi:hypothetical protein